jgi:endonuclease IV
MVEEALLAGLVLDPLVAHCTYLVNLATTDPLIYQRSTSALTYAARAMDRLRRLGAIIRVGSRGERPWPEAPNCWWRHCSSRWKPPTVR